MGPQVLPMGGVSFNPERFEALAATHRVTVIQGPPTLFHALIERARGGTSEFASLRVGVTGAAVIPPTLVRDLFEVLGLSSVVTSYGLTETTGVCTMTRPGDPVEVVAETSGRPIAGVDVRIIDEAGAQVAAAEQGQIVVQGIGLMRAYLDDPEATSATMSDGWLATGDRFHGRGWQSAHFGSPQGHGGGRRVMCTRPRSSGSSWRAPQCGRRRSSGCPTSGWARCRAPS